MNPWNTAWILTAWVIVAFAAGGTFIAHDPHIGFAAAALVAFMVTVITAGADRAEQYYEKRLKEQVRGEG